ncbi:sigma-70 family RNA polymerase sigma factor [Plantactinospora mayteni]|uniref:DNA-directed RNA polymerase sigma-70 factor n=1 Tax=Plantactinospora mayteni TaxID=566021 RepID=A0ABQ4ESG3_9ACTN|nr:RNA polymerase sigma factor [Plantactinospora mayteni]GIG97612.1 DNA-directed RNA polymerase sigma-70 factor [Plantactinospora mayteni]
MSWAERRGEQWFNGIFAAHYPDIVRYGLRRLADADTSVEIAQEVFEVAWRRREDVPDNSLPWLYGVARRLLANHWRARRTNPPAYPLPPDTAAIQSANGFDPSSVPVIADLRAALARLPEIDREIVRLIGWEQLTIAEAAQVLGCTRTAAKVRLHRARRRLATVLAAPVPTTSPAHGRGTQVKATAS